MGFEVPRRTIRLVFDDEEMAGAEVVCRSTSVQVYLDLLRVQSAASLDEIEGFVRRFGDEIIESWNLTRDGEPLPADGATLTTLEPATFRLMFQAWVQGMSGVSGPLAAPSPGGELYPGQSIPAMVPLSESPEN